MSQKIHGNNGKKRSQETKQKLKQIHIEQWKNPEYRKHMIEIHRGKVSNLKGKKWSIESRIKLSNSIKGRPAWNKGKPGLSGEKSPHWKGGISKIDKLCRRMFEYKQWRSDIFQRDNWTCQTCGAKGCYLTAHHIKSFCKIIKENNIKNIVEARNCLELWNINNGVTLCEECHKLTDNYKGRQKNKRAMLKEIPIS